RNALERAAILFDGDRILPEHLTFATRGRAADVSPIAAPEAATLERVGDRRRSPGPPAAAGDLEIVERATIEKALEQSRFNKSKAARTLGLTRQQLYVRLRRYGIE